MSRRLLLDANILVALFDADHIHHARVREWFLRHGDGFATCPIVEGGIATMDRGLAALHDDVAMWIG
ncbi:MAG: hypothetical protein WCY72_01785 [Lysobacteraceae bacterium]